MKFYESIFGLFIFGTAVILPHNQAPSFVAAQNGATTVPTTAEVEFEAEETTAGPTTTTPVPTTAAPIRVQAHLGSRYYAGPSYTQPPMQGPPPGHRGQPAFLARHQAPQTPPPRPRAIGSNCPTYKYTIDRNTVEFHTVPNSCKIVVQYPQRRRGGPNGSRGPPRVQYMARLP